MRATILSAAILGISATSFAATINFNDNFDTYADQTAFDAVWAPAGTATTLQSATLTSARSLSAPNSVSTPVNTTATSAATQGRSRYTAGEVGNIATSETLTFSFDFYDAATGNPQRNYVNLQDSTAPGSSNQLVSLGLSSNQLSTDSGGNYYMARILGYNITAGATDPDGGPAETGTLGTAPYFKLNDYGVGLRSVGWHNLKVLISTPDGTTQTYKFYVDNQLAETVSGIATLRSYDNIVIGSGLTNGGVAANYDNMSLVASTPEPTALAALACTGIGLLGRRRSR